jgi:hypothetical protein
VKGGFGGYSIDLNDSDFDIQKRKLEGYDFSAGGVHDASGNESSHLAKLDKKKHINSVTEKLKKS